MDIGVYHWFFLFESDYDGVGRLYSDGSVEIVIAVL